MCSALLRLYLVCVLGLLDVLHGRAEERSLAAFFSFLAQRSTWGFGLGRAGAEVL